MFVRRDLHISLNWYIYILLIIWEKSKTLSQRQSMPRLYSFPFRSRFFPDVSLKLSSCLFTVSSHFSSLDLWKHPYPRMHVYSLSGNISRSEVHWNCFHNQPRSCFYSNYSLSCSYSAFLRKARDAAVPATPAPHNNLYKQDPNTGRSPEGLFSFTASGTAI